MNALEIEHLSPEVPVAGATAGFAALRARLLRHARLLVNDRDLAEDLVQETLIAVLNGQARLRGDASLSTWAVAILRHKTADWYRSPTRNAMVGVEDFEACVDRHSEADACCSWDAVAEPGAAFAPPDLLLERRELASAIEDCVERLSARSRQVFMMREQMGFDTDEVCGRLGISPEHCRTLLHRARAALRGQLLAKDHAPSNSRNRRHAGQPGHDLLTDCAA